MFGNMQINNIYYLFKHILVMKNLTEFLNEQYIKEGAGHMSTRLGQGSSGVAYDLGNGWVRKTLRLAVGPQKGPRSVEHKITDLWSKVKNLKVITPIRNWDGDTYEMEKLQCPCKEGKLIGHCIDHYLFSANPEYWNDDRVKKMKKEVPEADFVIKWCEDFIDDVAEIIGYNNISSFSDDVRMINIGKDKHGNIKCFDWFDPWCSNVKL